MLKPLLEAFFSWARSTSQQPTSEALLDTPGDGCTTLVANYGSAFDFAALVDGLQECEMLDGVLSIRLCDSVMPFKARLGRGSSCQLRDLALKLPKPKTNGIFATDVLLFAQALRDVSLRVLGKPESMWRATSTPLGSYASRLGIIDYFEPALTPTSASTPKRPSPFVAVQGLSTPPIQPSKRARKATNDLEPDGAQVPFCNCNDQSDSSAMHHQGGIAESIPGAKVDGCNSQCSAAATVCALPNSSLAEPGTGSDPAVKADSVRAWNQA